jgi:hypothetical protein
MHPQMPLLDEEVAALLSLPAGACVAEHQEPRPRGDYPGASVTSAGKDLPS